MNANHNTSDDQPHAALDTIRLGAIAGAAGGLAEIAWVSLYAFATNTSPGLVARGVTTAAGVAALLPTDAAALGVGVHMGLAVMLGIALVITWRAMSARQAVNPFTFMIAALSGVWAINFFAVLPVVSPAFIGLLPYSVSLVSKLSFGLAAACALRLLAAPVLNLQHARGANGA